MIPQSLKCLFGFHAWGPWRYPVMVTFKHRVCGTCGKVQRRTR